MPVMPDVSRHLTRSSWLLQVFDASMEHLLAERVSLTPAQSNGEQQVCTFCPEKLFLVVHCVEMLA